MSLSSYLQDLRIGLVEICARNCLNLLQITAHIFTKRRIICDDPQGSELCDVNGQHAGTKADQRRMKLLRRCVDKKRERVRACADPIISNLANICALALSANVSPVFCIYKHDSRLAARSIWKKGTQGKTKRYAFALVSFCAQIRSYLVPLTHMLFAFFFSLSGSSNGLGLHVT